MSVINTNVKSVLVQNAMSINNRDMTKAMQQLSTGSRVNSAADDAAGLAISQTMTAQIKGLNQAVRNANDGISMLQTAEGALVEISDMLQRMRELAVQSANDTNSSTQRGYLNTEYQALKTEIDRIGANTTWNGFNLLTANGGADSDGAYDFQVGADATQQITVTIATGGSAITSTNLMVAVGDITTQALANTEIDALDVGLDAVNSLRATLGATINQLTHAADNLANISMNTQDGRSRVLDTDYAAATTELARTQIISQAATAMLAQANQQPATVLSLLQ